MPIPQQIHVLIERLNQELNQIEQEATEGLNLTRNQLQRYPDRSALIQIFARFGNYLVFVEVSRRRIEYSQVILGSEVVTDEQIQEAGEMLSELLGRILEAKIVVSSIKTRLEDWP